MCEILTAPEAVAACHMWLLNVFSLNSEVKYILDFKDFI